MPNSASEIFATEMEEIHGVLLASPESAADVPWRVGGWTRREILGHMLDSAANNHQRFVRAAIDGSYAGPTYKQQEWVDAHRYRDQPWQRLLSWWESYHQMLAAVVEEIPEGRLESMCVVGGNPPVTLRFLIEDYIEHQRHHLRQITAPQPPQ